MSVLPWAGRYRREAERLRRQLDADTVAAREARQRTAVARIQAVQSDRSSKSLMEQIHRNGWTELLQTAWGRRT